MSTDSAGTGMFAVASPIVAVVGAAFMGCCALASASFTSTSAYNMAEMLLIAGLPAFGLAQAVAIILGIAALVRCSTRKTAGLPEAVLGILAACTFILTAFYLLGQAIKPVSA